MAFDDGVTKMVSDPSCRRPPPSFANELSATLSTATCIIVGAATPHTAKPNLEGVSRALLHTTDRSDASMGLAKLVRLSDGSPQGLHRPVQDDRPDGWSLNQLDHPAIGDAASNCLGTHAPVGADHYYVAPLVAKHGCAWNNRHFAATGDVDVHSECQPW